MGQDDLNIEPYYFLYGLTPADMRLWLNIFSLCPPYLCGNLIKNFEIANERINRHSRNEGRIRFFFIILSELKTDNPRDKKCLIVA